MTAISLSNFTRASIQAGSTGRVVAKQTEDGDLVAVAEKRSFKAAVLEFLSNVPLLKNMDAVRSFIKDRNTTNEQVVSFLASALAEAYDSMPAGIAIEIFGKGKPLNESNLRQIMKNAELYYGVGDATKNEERVTINLWPFEDMNHGGHASITIEAEDGEHVSWWPNKDHEKPENKSRIARFSRAVDSVVDLKLGSNFVDQFGGSLESYAEDMSAEIKDSTAANLNAKKYAPRPTQIRNAETGKWEVPAQKINFPMVGKNLVDGEEKHIRFGLDKQAILADARNVKENAAAYLALANIKARALDEGRAEEYAELSAEIVAVKAELAGTIAPKGKETEESLQRARTNLEGRGNPELLAKVNSKLRHIELTAKLEELEDDLEDCAPVTQEELDAAQARADAAGPEIGYRFASDTNNCASMAIRVLLAGGAADYVEPPKMTTMGMSMIKPDEQFANYAFAVQKEMDRLNVMSDRMDSVIATGDIDQMRKFMRSNFSNISPNNHEQKLCDYLERAIQIIGSNVFQAYA